jgi:multidrug efflux pump subunit AcrA (membrane-fusion protein)
MLKVGGLMKKKLIVGIIIFSIIGVGIFYFLTTGNVGEKYNTVEVKQAQVEKYVEATGIVSSKAVRKYYGNGSQKIKDLTLALGDQVEKGQLLLEYEDQIDLEIQKVEKQIDALEASYGEILSGTDIESINNARIEISKIKENLASAIKDRDTLETLYNNEAVSKNELDQEISNVNQLESNLAIAQNNYNQLVKGVSKFTKDKYEAEIDALLLTIKSLQEKKENSEIYADINGVVTALNTFKGDTPSPGQMILEIYGTSEKILLVDFMVEDALKINDGMKAVIEDHTLGIYMDGLVVNQLYPKAFETLSELGVRENRQTVEISVPESSEKLNYGLEIDTKVMIEETRDALLIPKGAIYQKDLKTYVKVIEDGKAVEKEIKTGIEVENNVEVKEGLTEGTLVVLNYQED